MRPPGLDPRAAPGAPRWLAPLIVAAVILAPGVAPGVASEVQASQRGSIPHDAWRPRPPSQFGGVGLPAADADRAVELAHRIAVGTHSCRDWNGWWMEGAQLGPTALLMQIYGFQASVLGLPTTGACPLFGRMQDWGCPWYEPMTADQPAGARRVLRVTALVADLDSLCASAAWEWPDSRIPLTFGPILDLPQIGARAREVTLEDGALRFVMPTDPNGLAARWLAAGGPRWVGFALAVGDLGAATRALEGRGVHVLRAGAGRQLMGIVEPQETGGTLIELIEAPAP